MMFALGFVAFPATCALIVAALWAWALLSEWLKTRMLCSRRGLAFIVQTWQRDGRTYHWGIGRYWAQSPGWFFDHMGGQVRHYGPVLLMSRRLDPRRGEA